MRLRAFVFLALVVLVFCYVARHGRSQRSVLAQQQPAGAQQTPENDKPAPVLKTKNTDVMLPVTVRDKKGTLVTNLQPSDFSITDEGRPQTIKGVVPDSSLPFRIGLLVETAHPMSGVMEAERKAAGAFVDILLPDSANGNSAKDQAFLIHFDREVELLEDFTNSRQKLHKELEEMGPSRQAQNDTQGPETTGEDRGDRGHGGRGGNQLYDAIYLASDEVMQPKEGRKALIIFADGVDRGSKDRMNEALDAAEKAHVAIYTIYFKGEQERDNLAEYPGGGRRGGGWPGGGGGGYPGGGRPGGRRGGGPDESGVDGKKIMLLMAERTGGHAYDARKKDELEDIYKQILEELRGQYVLTYTPDKPDTEGGFHKIAVKVNKADFTLVAPEGYFAPGGDGSR